MPDLWKVVLRFLVIIALIYSLTGCKEAPIRTDSGSFYFIDNEDSKQRQRNPSLMIQDMEQDRRAETLKDIKKQDDRLQADRDKKLNELIDKQLHSQTENK
ncbi:MAG: hypothetical protein FIA91_10320 [Geobacter sp.]|nr:hypothetical protein [Geobacter sp.]